MDATIEGYFTALHVRRNTAEPMRHRDASFYGCESQCGKCHENVDKCKRQNPHLEAVRGWMIMSEDASGCCCYQAHSMIKDDGKLFDITLSEEEGRGIRFLRHHGTEDEFRALLERHAHQVFYPSRSSEDVLGVGAAENVAEDDEGYE